MIVDYINWHKTLSILSLKSAQGFWTDMNMPIPETPIQLIEESRRFIKNFRDIENDAELKDGERETKFAKWFEVVKSKICEVEDVHFFEKLARWINSNYAEDATYELHFFIWDQIFTRLLEQGGLNFELVPLPKSLKRHEFLIEEVSRTYEDKPALNQRLVEAEENPKDNFDQLLTNSSERPGMPNLFDWIHDIAMRNRVSQIWASVTLNYSDSEMGALAEWGNSQAEVMGMK